MAWGPAHNTNEHTAMKDTASKEQCAALFSLGQNYKFMNNLLFLVTKEEMENCSGQAYWLAVPIQMHFANCCQVLGHTVLRTFGSQLTS